MIGAARELATTSVCKQSNKRMDVLLLIEEHCVYNCLSIATTS